MITVVVINVVVIRKCNALLIRSPVMQIPVRRSRGNSDANGRRVIVDSPDCPCCGKANLYQILKNKVGASPPPPLILVIAHANLRGRGRWKRLSGYMENFFYGHF